MSDTGIISICYYCGGRATRRITVCVNWRQRIASIWQNIPISRESSVAVVGGVCLLLILLCQWCVRRMHTRELEEALLLLGSEPQSQTLHETYSIGRSTEWCASLKHCILSRRNNNIYTDLCIECSHTAPYPTPI